MITPSGTLNLNNIDIVELESSDDPSIVGVNSNFAQLAIQVVNDETLVWHKIGPNSTDWEKLGSNSSSCCNPFLGLTFKSKYDIINIANPTDRQLELWEVSPTIIKPVIYYANIDSWQTFCGIKLNQIDHGNGPSGTYSESFETDLGHYTNTGNDSFIRRTGHTPSNGTGQVNAYDGTYYIYTEVSSGHHVNTFQIETDYFYKLTNVDFYYNLRGSAIGQLEIQYQLDDGSWITHTTLGASSSDYDWDNINLDFTNLKAVKLRFKYSGATGWQGDCCIDMITLTSVD